MAPPAVGASGRATGRTSLVAATAGGKSAEALAARHGAVSDKPCLRDDAVIRRQVQMGEVRWFVKNPETMKYYLFPEHEWRLIELFDGARTRPEIVEHYNALYSFDPIDVSLVLEYEEMLRKMRLIAQSASERNLALLGSLKSLRQRAAEEKAEGFNPFFMLFHVLDPDQFMNRTVKYVRWIWSPPVVAIWVIAAIWTVGIFALHIQQLWAGTYELYAFLRKPLIDALQFFFILSFIGFFHEFGHGYAVKIYGGEVHDIGIALLYFTPAFYCETTDSLLFPSKWHRLWVTTAGIYVEGFLCSAATILWVASYPDTLLHELAYKTMLFTGVSTVFFNINPLIKIDGYYALTSLIEVPDLREDSFRYIGAVIQRKILRLPVDIPPVSRRRRRLFWIYGVLALAYTAAIMRLVGGLFYNLYHTLFPDIAVVLLVLTLYRIFRKRVRLVTRTARLFYLDKKELLMSNRARSALLAGAVLLVVLLFVPWTRRRISVEAVLRPASVARIEAPESGTVRTVFVRESENVRPGKTLFQLSSMRAGSDAAHAAGESERFTRAAAAARQASAPGQTYVAERRELAAAAALRREEFRSGRLDVRSPIFGRVLTGRVEDRENAYVTAGTVLAEIGDCRQMVAELPIPERLLVDLSAGDPVSALVASKPLSKLRGSIQRIAPATLEQPTTPKMSADSAPPGEIPDKFIAFAVFENADGSLRPGSVVRAKIYTRRSSYGARAWRVLSRWLQTLVW